MQENKENEKKDENTTRDKQKNEEQSENQQTDKDLKEDTASDKNSDNGNIRSLSFIKPDLLQRIQNTISLQNILLDINEIEIEGSVAAIESLDFFTKSHDFSILIRNIIFMSIFRPLYIIQYSILVKQILEKLKAKEHPTDIQSIDYHNILLKELFHYIFISDEVNYFNSFLHLTYQIYKQQVFTTTEIVTNIRKYFRKFILSKGPISSVFAMFAPEIYEFDRETYDMFLTFIQAWVSENIFNPATTNFYKKFDFYAENDFQNLKEIRNELSCKFKFFDIFINDDAEQLQNIFSNPEIEIDKMIESPFLSPFYFLTSGYSLLSCAASFGAVECFKYLIQNGANYENAKNTTQVAQYAMIGGSIEIIRICEQFNMNFDGTLQSSATFFRNEIFEYLYDTKNRNLLEVSPTKAIVIIQAATSNNLELMLNCLEMNCDVNQKDEYDMNCLKKASFFGLSQMTELLLSIPEIQLNQGELNFAASNGHYDTVKLIIEKSKSCGINYDINYVGITGKTALFDAIIHSHLKCVDLIYKNNGDLNFTTKEKNTISHFIASQNDVRIIEYMKDKIHFDINLKTKMYSTPLILSVLNSSIDMIEYLLENYHNDIEILIAFFSIKLAILKNNIYILKPFMKHKEYRDFIYQATDKSENLQFIKFVESFKNK